MNISGRDKHWREFKVYVLQVDEEKEKENDYLEGLGIKGSSEIKKEDAKLARLRIPLEDISEYYESYNSIKGVHGVAISTYPGANYFLVISYNEFVKMRREAGLENDPPRRSLGKFPSGMGRRIS